MPQDTLSYMPEGHPGQELPGTLPLAPASVRSILILNSTFELFLISSWDGWQVC